MFVWRVSLLSSLLLSAVEPARTLQVPLQDNAHLLDTNNKGRKLHGRFLQVTDFHPDPFYKVYSSISSDGACHRGSGPAGYYGAEMSDCDSPVSLINATFDWIRDEIKDSIDFVVWTGDSARHDNDEKIPRNIKQVVDLNEMLVQKFYDVFGKSGDEPNEDPTNDLVIPVVPTFGNNDILPHNIFDKGPNAWTRRYLDIWRNFIPEVQKHQFDQGGWYFVEVIPRRLVVISLNSLYFFNSNSAVDGCAAKSEPGYRQLDWLRIQLQYIRDRNMKAILVGHVPPARTENKRNWDETCWQKYALWMQQYRDVIVGSLYGHMNLDHFMIQDFHDIDDDVSHGYEIIPNTKRGLDIQSEPKFTTQASGNYLIELRETWDKLPKPHKRKTQEALTMYESIQRSSDEARPDWEILNLIEENLHEDEGILRRGKKNKNKPKEPEDYDTRIGGQFAQMFSVSHVSPSVVPNYFPTLRIYEYNITGVDSTRRYTEEVLANTLERDTTGSDEDTLDQEEEDEEENSGDDLEAERKKKKKHHKKKKKPKKHRFTIPEPPSSTSPPGPAYSPQALTLLGFTQYYANLTEINNDLFDDERFTPSDALDQQGWKDGKHHGKEPKNGQEPHPKKFKYEVLYDTRTDDVYKLPDLTVKSYLKLAQRIAAFKPEKDSPEIFEEDATMDSEEDSEDLEITGKKNKDGKKHKGHKKKKTRKANKPWYTFVTRAFVNTKDPEDVEEEFSG